MTSHPKTIFIIRHAEKTDDSNDPHLSEKGRRRAAALPSYGFPALSAVFAAMTTSESARPVETITPLAVARQLVIGAEVKDKEFPTLVEHVLAKKLDGKDILICWHHKEIPHLTRALGVNLARSHKWPDVYDRVWVLTYLIDGTVSFEDRPQRLLPGDSTT
jgi:broad specificity phosphatase PhoE